jgi:hypothetical protein
VQQVKPEHYRLDNNQQRDALTRSLDRGQRTPQAKRADGPLTGAIRAMATRTVAPEVGDAYEKAYKESFKAAQAMRGRSDGFDAGLKAGQAANDATKAGAR